MIKISLKRKTKRSFAVYGGQFVKFNTMREEHNNQREKSEASLLGYMIAIEEGVSRLFSVTKPQVTARHARS